MTTRMRLLVFLVLLSMQQYSLAQATDAEAQPDSGDRELKTNEEGYDFFSIDQLFMNNPQYAKLLSDLQAHSFGSNWRRKRDVEDAAEGAQVEEQDARREDDIDEQPMPDVAAESREETATTAAIAEITEVVRDTKETQETQEAEGRTTPVKTASPSSTTAALSSAAAVPSSTTAAGSFGFSGSTEATHGRPEEPTTSASPIRSSTPRRLLHKGGSKNKNKQGSANKNNQNKQQDSVTAQNVNKFTVTNTPTYTAVPPNSPSPSSSSSSSSSTPSQVTASVSPNSQATSSSSSSSSSPANSNMADATAAVAATTANATAGNKDKVGLAPTKYHYYPHNQHIYFLPECAIQQVCNAVYVRLNYTQPLCACPPRYRDPCSASLNEDDNHTIKLVGNAQRKAITLAKTCENTNELRECRAPKDWSILALQNSRTGKSHYLVICKCPPHFRLEGPLAHDQPTYAGLPGINVYGMLCVPPESYAPKPALKPAHPQQHIYNKWKVRPSTVSSYRSFQNVTQAEDYE